MSACSLFPMLSEKQEPTRRTGSAGCRRRAAGRGVTGTAVRKLDAAALEEEKSRVERCGGGGLGQGWWGSDRGRGGGSRCGCHGDMNAGRARHVDEQEEDEEEEEEASSRNCRMRQRRAVVQGPSILGWDVGRGGGGVGSVLGSQASFGTKAPASLYGRPLSCCVGVRGVRLCEWVGAALVPQQDWGGGGGG